MPKKSKKTSKKSKKGLKKRPVLRAETKKGIWVVVCFAAVLVSLLSFVGVAGIFGRYFTQFSKILFGTGFFLVTVIFLLAGLAIIQPRFKSKGKSQTKAKPAYRAILIGIFILIFSVLGIFHIFSPEAKTGGYLGLVLGYPLANYFGFWAGLVILLALLTISVLITFNVSLLPSKKEEQQEWPDQAREGSISQTEVKKGLWQRIKSGAQERKDRRQMAEAEQKGGGEVIGAKPQQSFVSQENISEDKKESVSPASAAGFDLKQQRVLAGDYQGPSLDFLQKDKGQPTSGDIKANINIIKRTLENFGIQVEMAEVNVGPTVTQYTLRPAQGVKLSRITALQNDLSLALAAHPLRIEAPIAGRSLVGIEIPNRSVITVRLRSLLERPAFQESVGKLTFAVGRDVAGNPIFANLSQMPHLLVAGATGAGKTVALNNLIISLLYGNSPSSMRLILIDPKRVELSVYEGIPHLLSPVIVNADKAIGALRWAISEMERRFGILQEAGKRDILSYNGALAGDKQDQAEPLPYIVIIIDELADLMSSHGREVEGAIVRLAQMARAVGIHLVVSTQRPSVEVITGLIKANITSRMAFQVASQIDSRTILDMAGAEKLLGNGDMLFIAGNSAKPRRVQGAFLDDREINKVVDYLRQLAQPEYEEEVVEAATLSGPRAGSLPGSAEGEEAGDELYDQAKEIVIRSGKASASLLQRRLRVGYARAARLLDILEENGVVGPGDGAKPRQVFIDQGAEKEIE